MNLTVGQQVKMIGRHRYPTSDQTVEVVKLGRKYVTVSWGPASHQQEQFDRETGYAKGDRYGNGARLKTIEEVEAEERLAAAKNYLWSVGIDVTYRSAFNPQNIHLNPPLVEELAAIVKNMMGSEGRAS